MEINNDRKMKGGADIFYQKIIDSARIGIITISSNNSITMVNSEAERIFGYHNDEIINKEINILFHSLDYVKFQEYLKGALKLPKKDDGKIFELRGIHKNAKSFPVEINISVENLDVHGTPAFP